MIKYLTLFLCMIVRLSAQEASGREILSRITDTKKLLIELEAKNGLKKEELLFITFWNFDETILDGDTTEGRADLYGKVIFKGLAQIAIESGLSKKYSSFASFWKDYKAMETMDEPKAYAYPAQILAGAEQKKVLQLSTQYFEHTLKPFLFQTSLELIRALQKEDISVQIITASPRIFVQGSAQILGIPPEDFFGMETVVKNGRFTDQMVLPLTTAEGKIKKIQQIVQEKMRAYKKVYVLAGFGNYNLNDIPFLKWIGSQQFPVGKPLAVIDYHPPSIPQTNMVLLRLSQDE